MSHNLVQKADGTARFLDKQGRSSLRIGTERVTPGTTAGITLDGQNSGNFYQTVIRLTAVSLSLVDAGTAGSQGYVKIMTFPEGLIGYIGGVASVSISVTAGVNATGAMVASIGSASAGTGDASLTTTEADFIPSTACTLSSDAGTFTGKSTTALIAVFDGTASAKDVYLNIAVADASSTADATATLNGTVTLNWGYLGDV